MFRYHVKIKTCLILITLILTGLVYTGCGDEKFIFDFENIKCDGQDCRILGTIAEDFTITADKNWLLRGTVFVGTSDNPVTLTIESGSVIKADSGLNSTLVVSMSSKIIAIGTKDQPIIFTSDKPKGERMPGDWGGIVINGLATQNYCMTGNRPSLQSVCTAFGEGLTMDYGGNNDDDNSGILKYVRIEFAGQYISPFADLNGLTLYAVGSKTEIDFLQVHKSGDDGVELFGGTVNLRHIFITGANDDSLDWTDGWRGKGQFIVLQQYAGLSDNGIEANNVYRKEQAEPTSNPTLANMTIVGTNLSQNSDIGIVIRGGSKASIYSSIITGFRVGCIDFDDKETFEQAANDPANLAFVATITDCDTNFVINDQLDDPINVYEDEFNVEDFFNNGQNNFAIDPQLIAPFNIENPDFRLSADSPAKSGAILPDDDFFDDVDFIGAFGNDSNWIEGWTTN